MKQEQKQQSNGSKLTTFAYYVEWLAFISAILSAVYLAIKDKKAPNRNEYNKQ